MLSDSFGDLLGDLRALGLVAEGHFERRDPFVGA
jgi:hypothetical protein